jgi:hypothetical protein
MAAGPTRVVVDIDDRLPALRAEVGVDGAFDPLWSRDL